MSKNHSWALFAGFLFFGLANAAGVPWNDDARFYVEAAGAYGEWFEGLFTGDSWSREATDAAFRTNREHPPVAKYIMAAGWLTLHHWTDWLDPVAACRVGVLLLWALLCTAVCRVAQRYMARGPALFAGMALATMPRFFYHGHAETLDLTVAALYFFAADSLYRYLETPTMRGLLRTTLLFGLALGSKLNAPFLLVAGLGFWFLRNPPRLNGVTFKVPPLPWGLLTMAVLGPGIVWLIWPWMWFDTAERLSTYIDFHLRHYPIALYYGGTLYKQSIAPVWAPLGALARTTPVPTLALALVGGLAALRLGWAQARRLVGANPQGSPTAVQLFALYCALHVAVQLLAVSLPTVPKYGGVKLFLPAMPFLAVLAGMGMQAVLPREPKLAWATIGIALLPGLIGIGQGRWLSYYNALAGGTRGATAAGFERQYYDLAYPEIAAQLATLLPDGGVVAVAPNPKEYRPYFAWWRRAGKLPPGVRMGSRGEADLMLLTHERRWRRYPDLAADSRHWPKVGGLRHRGVTLFTIHRLP